MSPLSASGSIVSKYPGDRVVKIALRGKKRVKFKVDDDFLWWVISNAVGRIAFDYDVGYPYPIITNVVTNVKLEFLGAEREQIDFLRIKYDLIKEIDEDRKRLYLDDFFLHIEPTGTPLDLIILIVLIVILFGVAIYYLLFIPIIVGALSFLTLGEAKNMIRKDYLYMEVNTKDKNFCERLRKIVGDAVFKKIAIKNILEKCVDERLAKLNSTLLEIYKKFRRGLNIQFASLMMFIILYILTGGVFEVFKISSWILIYLEFLLGAAFAAGFILSLIGGWSRRLFKPDEFKGV